MLEMLNVKSNGVVIPAKLAIASASRNPGIQKVLDSRFRGKDGRVELGTGVYSEKSPDESGKI